MAGTIHGSAPPIRARWPRYALSQSRARAACSPANGPAATSEALRRRAERAGEWSRGGGKTRFARYLVLYRGTKQVLVAILCMYATANSHTHNYVARPPQPRHPSTNAGDRESGNDSDNDHHLRLACFPPGKTSACRPGVAQGKAGVEAPTQRWRHKVGSQANRRADAICCQRGGTGMGGTRIAPCGLR